MKDLLCSAIFGPAVIDCGSLDVDGGFSTCLWWFERLPVRRLK